MTVRGGLDDALDKLARRDELRRRATGADAPSTPPAVTELVEAIAAVVARHPSLAVTVGVEGVGDPVLLQFAFAGGTVQVRADRSVADRPPPGAGRTHADFEINVEDPEPPPRGSHDDQDRFGPTDYDYAEPPTAERPFVTPQSPAAPPPPPPAAYAPPPVPSAPPFTPPAPAAPPFVSPVPSAPPFAPPVPPASHAEPTAFQEPVFQEPLPYQEPVPFQANPAEETEMAARRLAAMLRDNPTLLDDTRD
ncbi:hypothetical protein BJY16_001352 [Actinoplanes octamycinicus]|uniref:Uncharacterized protein n=1 Tax=Actinoplanes octamycinicus TaxID=135948 RepID=A0A7W7GT94_9ACTN|nr:hypothetical protein [Actinoplanes octamycinicus]MBB4737893.1 hypothetical protein [Actinoplanes octamycinicus]GIE59054.1 hypothetical protein Aoc01nite_44560 [Actinoplanes octamycinicus]